MSKSILRSYLEYNKRGRNKKQFEYLSNSCFQYGDNFLISDSYSVILLRDTRGLEIKDDKLGLYLHYQSMEVSRKAFKEMNTRLIKESKEDYIKLFIDNYGLDVKLAQKMIKLIKANRVEILESIKEDYCIPPIIKISNDDTKEVGYLLPMRIY